jgi:hypothetical protein
MIEEFEYVVDNSKYVHINKDKLNEFIKELDINSYKHWFEEIDLNLNEKDSILLVCIIESMNFCFWKKPKWKIEYKNEVYSGSNALFYSVIKEVENNSNFLNIDYLYNLSFDEFSKIFKGEGICPHLDKRYNNFKEVINYIKNNDFYTELYSIKSDRELIEFITSKFKYFDDKSVYKDKVIHFNKRATLLVNDLYNVANTIKNNIGNIDSLSGCADYAIPRILRDYGVLEYDSELTNLIDKEIEVDHDSEMEIEIRANMLYVIELIRKKLNNKINSVELDSIVWNMSRNYDRKSVSHHTVTIYY